jgi:hypothetical protein
MLGAAALALLLVVASPPCRGADAPPPPSGAAADGMPASCPMHAAHMAAAHQGGAIDEDAARHAQEVDARGDVAMGFSQAATTHHFRLATDGGTIEVTVRDPADAATLAQVRAHLRAIATAFAAGDFAIPEMVHAQVPPGVEGMRAAGADLHFTYGEVERGATVTLTAATPIAIAAVHDFLRFQIAEHRTGDAVAIGR